MMSTPAVFLTWCRSPGLSLHPGPLWTSLPSSSRWAGWRHRCSRRTPGKSGSKHFLQRQEMTCCHAWLSHWLVKGTPFMCTAPKILHHIIALPSKPVTVAETLRVILSVTWAFKIFAQTFPQQIQTCTHAHILPLKVHVKRGCMSENVSRTHNTQYTSGHVKLWLKETVSPLTQCLRKRSWSC